MLMGYPVLLDQVLTEGLKTDSTYETNKSEKYLHYTITW